MIGSHKILVGDVLDRLAEIPDESVHCCVTSPPYWGLRCYGVDGQIGLEATPDEFVARMVEVFREVRRVLRPDGTCWLNLGDSYSGSGEGGGGNRKGNEHGQQHDAMQGKRGSSGLKPKDLVGIPWRVALALQQDGWWLRQDIIWSKPNPMPESVRDRCTKSHEYIFLLTKSPRYYYDAEAIKENGSGVSGGACFGKVNHAEAAAEAGQQTREYDRPEYGTRNRRSVWTITTQPYPDAHFATFPEELPRLCIAAGTSERGCCPECGKPWVRRVERTPIPDGRKTTPNRSGSGDLMQGWEGVGGGETKTRTLGWTPSCSCDCCIEEHGQQPYYPTIPCTVLDPFSGSGTTGAVACTMGRDYIGIELNPEYAAMSERRIGRATRPNTYRDMTDDADAPLFNGIDE